MSQPEIACRMQCSLSIITVMFLERFHPTGSLNDEPRPGRLTVTTPQQDHYNLLQHLCDRFCLASQTAKETVGVHGRCLGANTFYRHPQSNGLSWKHVDASETCQPSFMDTAMSAVVT